MLHARRNLKYLVGTQRHFACRKLELPFSLKQNDELFMAMVVRASARSFGDFKASKADVLSLCDHPPIQLGHGLSFTGVPIEYLHTLSSLYQSAASAARAPFGWTGCDGMPSGVILTGFKNGIRSRKRAPTCSIGCCCSRFRVALNDGRPASFSAIHLRA